jgi:hypothetical protein
MINTKKEPLTPQARKEKTLNLREEHNAYFKEANIEDALYIPKMAYRPTGKDELYISFFPSELEKEVDVYTEFVSIDYDSEDAKRTLYLHKYNPHWKTEYEIIESSNGFSRHMIPVSELKIINDINSRRAKIEVPEIKEVISEFKELKNPDEIFSHRAAIEALVNIAKTLERIEQKLK